MLENPRSTCNKLLCSKERYIVDGICYSMKNSYPYVRLLLVLRATKAIINAPVKHRSREVGEFRLYDEKLLGLWFNEVYCVFHYSIAGGYMADTVFAVQAFYMAFTHCNQKFVNPAVPMGFSSTMLPLYLLVVC